MAILVSGSPVMAQSRHGYNHGGRSMSYQPHYYRPYGYGPRVGFYGYFGAPYYPYYWPYYGGPFYPGYYGYYGSYSPWASFRIEVKPREANVYLDAYYAGIVDDYDGAFQRLNVPPGNHEIAVYLEGYRTIRQALYVSPGSSYKIKQEMVPLAPGEAQEPPPEAAPPDEFTGNEPPAVMTPQAQLTPAPTMPSTPPAAAAVSEPADFGVLEVRVQPSGVRLRIDGEPWLAEPAGPVSIHLPQGRHRVEIEKEGFQSFAGDVVVSSGRTTTLNVKLSSSRSFEEPQDRSLLVRGSE